MKSRRFCSTLLSLSMVLGMLPFNTLADAISGITIDEINFPDDNFRQFLLSSVSGCEDGIKDTKLFL